MTSRITGICSMATRQVLAELATVYEQGTGCQVAIRLMGGVDAARLVRAGDPTDVVILASNVMEQLEAENHIVAGSRASFVRSGIAMAVRAGAPQPSVKDEQAVREAILQARKVCYSSGPSGDHLKRLWERWGIAEAISSRVMQALPGVPVGTLVAQGDADLGFQQLSELLHLPGIDIVGSLPVEIQVETVFSAGVCRASSSPQEARALIAYLTSPGTEAAKRRHGMGPP